MLAKRLWIYCECFNRFTFADYPIEISDYDDDFMATFRSRNLWSFSRISLKQFWDIWKEKLWFKAEFSCIADEGGNELKKGGEIVLQFKF